MESDPRWEKDSDVTNCRGCSVKFTLIKRKHHCRACLRIFCSGKPCCSCLGFSALWRGSFVLLLSLLLFLFSFFKTRLLLLELSFGSSVLREATSMWCMLSSLRQRERSRQFLESGGEKVSQASLSQRLSSFSHRPKRGGAEYPHLLCHFHKCRWLSDDLSFGTCFSGTSPFCRLFRWGMCCLYLKVCHLSKLDSCSC